MVAEEAKPVTGWIEVRAATTHVVPLYVEGLAAVVVIGKRRVKERQEGAACEGAVRIGGDGKLSVERNPRSAIGRRIVGEMVDACRRARR